MFFSSGCSAPLSNGDVVTVDTPDAANGGGINFTLRDEDGNTIDTWSLFGPEAYTAMDVAEDAAQGQIVLVGMQNVDTTPTGFAARIAPDGTLLWSQALSYGSVDDYTLSLSQTADGKLVVVGFSDLEAFIVAFTGNIWLTLLNL